jgi:hypothetical protein
MPQDDRRPTNPSRGRRVPGESVKQAHYRWPLDRTRDRAHGRVSCEPHGRHGRGFASSRPAQVILVIRKARDLRTRRWRTVTVYTITGLAEPMG